MFRFLLGFLALLTVGVGGSPVQSQPVGQVTFAVTDVRRADPVVPDARREWMVTVYYPAAGKERASDGTYAPDAELLSLLVAEGYYDTPKAEIERWGTAPATAISGAPAVKRTLPLITLSPGLGVAAFNYSRLAAALASRGFAVAVIDHPYIGISHLPGGRFLKADDYPIVANEDMRSWKPAIADWAKDISVTLDRIGTTRGRQLAPGLKIETRRVVAVGHSIGGTIALQTCEQESRVVACANFEGSPEGTVVNDRGPTKPVLFVGSRSGKPDRPHVAPPLDRAPYSAFTHGSGPATWLVAIRGGSHMSFSDAPFVMPTTLSRFGGELMPPARSMDVYVGMTAAFARSYGGSRLDTESFETWLRLIPEIKYRFVHPADRH